MISTNFTIKFSQFDKGHVSCIGESHAKIYYSLKTDDIRVKWIAVNHEFNKLDMTLDIFNRYFELFRESFNRTVINYFECFFTDVEQSVYGLRLKSKFKEMTNTDYGSAMVSLVSVNSHVYILPRITICNVKNNNILSCPATETTADENVPEVINNTNNNIPATTNTEEEDVTNDDQDDIILPNYILDEDDYEDDNYPESIPSHSTPIPQIVNEIERTQSIVNERKRTQSIASENSNGRYSGDGDNAKKVKFYNYNSDEYDDDEDSASNKSDDDYDYTQKVKIDKTSNASSISDKSTIGYETLNDFNQFNIRSKDSVLGSSIYGNFNKIEIKSSSSEAHSSVSTPSVASTSSSVASIKIEERYRKNKIEKENITILLAIAHKLSSGFHLETQDVENFQQLYDYSLKDVIYEEELSRKNIKLPISIAKLNNAIMLLKENGNSKHNLTVLLLIVKKFISNKLLLSHL